MPTWQHNMMANLNNEFCFNFRGYVTYLLIVSSTIHASVSTSHSLTVLSLDPEQIVVVVESRSIPVTTSSCPHSVPNSFIFFLEKNF